jgi:hypothetical protein
MIVSEMKRKIGNFLAEPWGMWLEDGDWDTLEQSNSRPWLGDLVIPSFVLVSVFHPLTIPRTETSKNENLLVKMQQSCLFGLRALIIGEVELGCRLVLETQKWLHFRRSELPVHRLAIGLFLPLQQILSQGDDVGARESHRLWMLIVKNAIFWGLPLVYIMSSVAEKLGVYWVFYVLLEEIPAMTVEKCSQGKKKKNLI